MFRCIAYISAPPNRRTSAFGLNEVEEDLLQQHQRSGLKGFDTSKQHPHGASSNNLANSACNCIEMLLYFVAA